MQTKCSVITNEMHCTLYFMTSYVSIDVNIIGSALFFMCDVKNVPI